MLKYMKHVVILHFLIFNRLVDAHRELDETKSKSATTLLATEDEILQLKAEWVIQSNTVIRCEFSDTI